MKPGRTEITINNLTPLADEHSIKVEGHGMSAGAVVTDMTVDSVANRMMGEDSEDSEDSEDGESEESEDEDALRPPELKAVIAELKALRSTREELQNRLRSAGERLGYLRRNMQYCAENVPAMPELEGYKSQDEALYKEMKGVREEIEKVDKQINAVVKKEARLQRAFDRQRRKPRRERELKKALKRDKREEKREQKLQLPSRVYRIKITVENGVLPAETKTVTAVAEMGRSRKPEDDEMPVRELPYLRISYITGGASWTPHYDLRLDSTKQQGTLTYRAHYTNRTGETWKDAKITLSTSQNTFSGLEDKVPWMAAWNVTLQSASSREVRDDGGLLSPAEVKLRKELHAVTQSSMPQETVNVVKDTYRPRYSYNPASPSYSPVAATNTAPEALRDALRAKKKRVSTATTTSSSSYRAAAEPSSDDERRLTRFNSAHRERERASPPSPPPPPSDGPSSRFPLAELAKLQVATSSAESHGMTTIYDLPGVRTITSSKLIRRHIITDVTLPTVEFSHLAVPKLRSSVFLKARVINPKAGGVTFLHGKAGLTLDGSFMGNTSIPLCVPGDHFDVGLGVDESIQVHYSKPSKKSSSQGMIMMKENVVNYCRSIRIHNARQGPVKIFVLDQVPVSDDERLRISLLQPRGLRDEGDQVAVAPAKSKLGTAQMRKNGEILWELRMDNGGDLDLPLEYEARMPQGSAIVVK